MTNGQTRIPGWLNNQERVLTVLGMGIAGSLVFWPVLNSILGITLFVYWLLVVKKEFSLKQQKGRLVVLFVLLYVLAMAGYLYSANTGEAWFKLQQQSALAMFPIVFGTSLTFTRNVQKNILFSFVWFTFAGCLFCLGNGLFHFVQTGSPNMLHGYSMVVLKDMSPFMLGLYCLLCVMYLMNRLYESGFRSGTEKNLYMALLVFLCIFLFLLGNRNVLFSWCVVLMFFFLKNLVGKRFRFVFFGLLALALAASAIFNPSFRRQLNDLSDFSAANTIELDSDKSLGRSWGGKALRMAIWKCSSDIISNHWLTGVGTGDVQDSLQAAYERRQFYFASRYNRYNAHNQFVQHTLAYGVVGFVVFAACLLVPFLLYVKKPGYQLYCLFLISFLSICMTESILEISKGIIFYSFFNSIFAFVHTDVYGTKAT
jgi:O-antigen ligase